jgi:hypothetical protein
VPYVEPALPDDKATAAPASGKSRDWLAAQIQASLKEILDARRNDSVLYHGATEKLAAGATDLEGAKALVDKAMDGDRADFDRFVAELWDKVKWAALGIVAEERAPKEALERIRTLREIRPATPAPAPSPAPTVRPAPAAQAAGAAVAPAATAPAGGAIRLAAVPAHSPTAGVERWLHPELERLSRDLVALMWRARSQSKLYHAVKEKILLPEADVEGALLAVEAEFGLRRPEYEGMTAQLWDAMKWVLVGVIADEKGAAEVAKIARGRASAAHAEPKPAEAAE